MPNLDASALIDQALAAVKTVEAALPRYYAAAAPDRAPLRDRLDLGASCARLALTSLSGERLWSRSEVAQIALDAVRAYCAVVGSVDPAAWDAAAIEVGEALDR